MVLNMLRELQPHLKTGSPEKPPDGFNDLLNKWKNHKIPSMKERAKEQYKGWK